MGVPLIVKGPGLPQGKTIDHPVTLVDMYPTIMDMVGVPTEADRPGHSWLPLIQGEPQDRPDYAFASHHGNFLRHDWFMLVRGDRKSTYYANERPSLFNVERDPQECQDLASDPQYAPILREFEELLHTILDPEETSMRAKRAMGLIGPDGTDYTEAETVEELQRMLKVEG